MTKKYIALALVCAMSGSMFAASAGPGSEERRKARTLVKSLLEEGRKKAFEKRREGSNKGPMPVPGFMSQETPTAKPKGFFGRSWDGMKSAGRGFRDYHTNHGFKGNVGHGVATAARLGNAAMLADALGSNDIYGARQARWLANALGWKKNPARKRGFAAKASGAYNKVKSNRIARWALNLAIAAAIDSITARAGGTRGVVDAPLGYAAHGVAAGGRAIGHGVKSLFGKKMEPQDDEEDYDKQD